MMKQAEKQYNSYRFENELIDTIKQRTKQVSENVQKKVESIIIPNIINFWDNAFMRLESIEKDFSSAIQGWSCMHCCYNYEDLTKNEIEELYFVLYGKSIQEK